MTIVTDMLELVYMFLVSHELLIPINQLNFIFNIFNPQVLDASVTATSSHLMSFCSQLKQSFPMQFALNHSHFWFKIQLFVPLDHQTLITQYAMVIQVFYSLNAQVRSNSNVHLFRWPTYYP